MHSATFYLNQNSLLNIDILENIGRKHTEILFSTSDGVLLYNSNINLYMISAETEKAFNEMLPKINKPNLIAAHQQFYMPKLHQVFPFPEIRTCIQAAYFSKNTLSINLDSDAEIKCLNESHLDILTEKYTHAADGTDYLLNRLQNGKMFGYFKNGKIAGFIGTHGEHSIGLLEVFPEYRRMGIASALLSFMVNRRLNEGHIPFSQIEVGNKASEKLHQKLNFSISEEPMYWLLP